MVDFAELKRKAKGDQGEKVEEDFEKLMKKAINEINRIYPEGLTEHLIKNYPELDREFDRVEGKIHYYYEARDYQNFREALRSWYKLFKKAQKGYIPGETQEATEEVQQMFN